MQKGHLELWHVEFVVRNLVCKVLPTAIFFHNAIFTHLLALFPLSD